MNNERWDEATEGGRPAKELFSTAWDDFRSYGYQDLKALREDLLERANAVREKTSSLEGDLQERVDKMIERWKERAPRRRAKWFFTIRARAAGALLRYSREKGPPPTWDELSRQEQEAAQEGEQNAALRDLASKWKEEFDALEDAADGRNEGRMELFRRAVRPEADDPEDEKREAKSLYDRISKAWKRRLTWPEDIGSLEDAIEKAVSLREKWRESFDSTSNSTFEP